MRWVIVGCGFKAVDGSMLVTGCRDAGSDVGFMVLVGMGFLVGGLNISK
jgi:hypothetical protein